MAKKKLTKKASMKARDKRMGERPDIPAGTKIDLKLQRRTRYESSGIGSGRVTRKTVTVRVPVGQWAYHVKDDQGRRYRLTFVQGEPVRMDGDKADYDVVSSDFNAPETNPTAANFWSHYEATDSRGRVYPLKTRSSRPVVTHALIGTWPAHDATTFSSAVEEKREAMPITPATAAKRAKHMRKNFGAFDIELVEVVAVPEPSVSTNPTNDMDRGLILDEGEIFAKTGSHRQRHRVYQVLGRKPQTYYNLFEGDKTAGASRFVVTEAEFQKLKDAGVKVTRSRLKTPNEWHPHIDFGSFRNNPGTPPTTAADLTRRLEF